LSACLRSWRRRCAPRRSRWADWLKAGQSRPD
jgi:hypothetical protein